MTTERREARAQAAGLVAIACLALTLGLASCSRQTTLTFAVYSGNNWGVPEGNSYAIYDQAKQMFEALPENAGIKVKLITGTLYRDYSEWFAQRVLQGKEPDLFMVKDEDINTFASVGILQDLGPYIRKDKHFSYGAFYLKATQAGSHGGVQYSLPISVVPLFLIVNTSLMNREGVKIDRAKWNWDQFYRICRQLTKDTDGDGVVDQFGEYGYTWDNALYADGQTLISPDGSRVAFGDSAFEETVDYLKSLYKLNRGAVVKESDFDRGKAGFKTFNLSEYRTYGTYPYRILKYSNFEWEVLPFPSGPHGHSMSRLYTVQIGMSARSRQKEAAYKFLKFMTESEAYQRSIWHTSNVLPSNKSVLEKMMKSGDYNTDNDARLLRFVEDNRIMEHLYVDPPFKWYPELKARIDDQILKIAATDENVENGIQALRKGIEKYLQEQRN